MPLGRAIPPIQKKGQGLDLLELQSKLQEVTPLGVWTIKEGEKLEYFYECSDPDEPGGLLLGLVL
jgi:hypothetical protein